MKTPDCYIKTKPSSSKKEFEDKYGRYRVKRINGEMVPFEVIYLNMLKSGNAPKIIISFYSAAIWNIALIHQAIQKKGNILCLMKAMKDFYLDYSLVEETISFIDEYNQCLSDYRIYAPDSWEEFYKYMNSNYEFFETVDTECWKQDEQRWLRRQYVNVTGRERRITNPRFHYLRKWLEFIYEGKSIESYFIRNRMNELILYGSGDYAQLFLKAAARTE